MRNRLTHVGLMAGLMVCLLLVADTRGQDVKPADIKPAQNSPSVHQMTIYNGPNRTVRYFTTSPSLSEQNALRDLERAENEAQYAGDLLDLRRQLVSSEMALDPARRYMQDIMYGMSRDRSRSSSLSGSDYLVGSINGGVIGGAFGGWGGGWGYPYGDVFNNVAVGPSYSQNRSVRTVENVAYGIGPDGVIKEALAPVIARQATPEYAAQTTKAYQDALASAVGATSRPARAGQEVVGAGGLGSLYRPMVNVLMKGGEKIEGLLVKEDPDWLLIDTEKEEVRVRTSEVARITTLKKK
jgi:hypothetical protein